ncbi:MAG: acetyl-CoA carboxylase, carboxyltransferase subunit beta [Pelagibacteraceae bacterium TMED237]|nr:MAG: acetyl-CoA carboxylase, carboxyltransferase subunit beta [Pelagibacteraceae bacterium TMED237]|tara:strand:- start:2212 stop:3054 length:843 start_codon:yes stop_codon:yes gene_type:complete
MNWLTNFVKPKLSSLVKRRSVPERLWSNCLSCGNMIHHKDLNDNLRVCMNCDYHFRMSAEDRIKLFFKENEYNEIELDEITDDPLNFSDKKKYKDRLKEYRNKTKRKDAFILIEGKIENIELIAGLMNFEFMGGSMGRAVGGAIVKGAKIAVEKKLPYVVVTSSGGARMQEGIISLMQMPRTIAAVNLLNENKIPYIVILTEPTTGGVTASFAMLGDITIAEKGATIGFAGKRVIQDTIREELPIDFQKAEYLKEHGMVDIVSHRKDLRSTLHKLLQHLS